jgi:uncharacterized protein (TIGR00730 family)
MARHTFRQAQNERDVNPDSGQVTLTVYGSGDPSPEVQRLAEELGRGIALRGWTLRNGGYGGTMRAAARSAREAGGRVVGVTCSAFARPSPNEFVSETIETADLFQRLARLIQGADAFVALPGGTGTLTELFLTWELMAKGLVETRPLCLLGREWDVWWRAFRTDPELASRLRFLAKAEGADEALAHVEGRLGNRSGSEPVVAS